MTLTPHAGAIVTSFTKKDIEEIFQLRIELESWATKLAVNHLSNAHISGLDEIDLTSVGRSRYDQLNR